MDEFRNFLRRCGVHCAYHLVDGKSDFGIIGFNDCLNLARWRWGYILESPQHKNGARSLLTGLDKSKDLDRQIWPVSGVIIKISLDCLPSKRWELRFWSLERKLV